MNPAFTMDREVENAYLALGAALAAQEHPMVLATLVNDLAAVLAPHDALASLNLTLSATALIHLHVLQQEVARNFTLNGAVVTGGLFGSPTPERLDRMADHYREQFRSRSEKGQS